VDMLGLFASDSSGTLVAVLVFLAAATLSFGIMAVIRVQGSVRRRAANIGQVNYGDRSGGSRSLRHAGVSAAQRLMEYAARHHSSANSEDMKILRRRMIQAGIYDSRAVSYFFFARTALAIGLTVLAFFFIPGQQASPLFWLMTGFAGVLGYIAPSFYIDRRIKTRKAEHQAGFPDFMDLLVVCADAGLSMEAALERVGRELGDSYPSLTANIHMANLEMRAGRTMSDALEHLADRLGLEEARSFATLIQQSAELGSSITDALRVYSEDMRHKRLSRAEEKAYSLPAKLSLPMMICIFPVLFVVILLPVFVRLYVGNY
jgi:tight adherence protein C